MIFTFGMGGAGDITEEELYEALKYSGLVTPDMTKEQMLEVLENRFPQTVDVLSAYADDGWEQNVEGGGYITRNGNNPLKYTTTSTSGYVWGILSTKEPVKGSFKRFVCRVKGQYKSNVGEGWTEVVIRSAKTLYERKVVGIGVTNTNAFDRSFSVDISDFPDDEDLLIIVNTGCSGSQWMKAEYTQMILTS